MRWICECSCGREHVVRSGIDLRRGDAKRCTLCRQELRHTARRTHGQYIGGSRSPTVNSFSEAKRRCTDPKYKYYHRYGGRGIRFLLKNVQEVLDDIGPRPPGKTLERINPNGDYVVGNICWLDAKGQAENRHTTIFVEVRGLRMTQKAFCESLGIHQQTFISWRKQRKMTAQQLVDSLIGQRDVDDELVVTEFVEA